MDLEYAIHPETLWEDKADEFLDNQGSDSRRGAGLVLINVVGQCGPVLGTQIFPTTDGPRYVKGMTLCAAFMFFCAVVALALRTLLVMQNKKLDREQAVKGDEYHDDGKAIENYGNNFRYVL